MKALRFDRFGEVEAVLHVEELPTPVPGPDEVMVEVHAASINPSVGTTRVGFDLLDFYRRQLTLFGANTSRFDTVASADVLDGLRLAFEQGKLTPPDIARTCSLDEGSRGIRTDR